MAVRTTESTQKFVNTLAEEVLGYENNIGISDIKEYLDECISSPVSTEINSRSLHDQTAQLALDCSSFCSSDESGAAFELVDFGSCFDSCFTKR